MLTIDAIRAQARYWAKQSDRYWKLSQAAAKQCSEWSTREADRLYAAFHGDPRFQWRFDLEDELYKANIGDHLAILQQEPRDNWQWFVRSTSGGLVAGSVSPVTNPVDCIAELTAYYDQFIEKKAAING